MCRRECTPALGTSPTLGLAGPGAANDPRGPGEKLPAPAGGHRRGQLFQVLRKLSRIASYDFPSSRAARISGTKTSR